MSEGALRSVCGPKILVNNLLRFSSYAICRPCCFSQSLVILASFFLSSNRLVFF